MLCTMPLWTTVLFTVPHLPLSQLREWRRGRRVRPGVQGCERWARQRGRGQQLRFTGECKTCPVGTFRTQGLHRGCQNCQAGLHP